MEITPTEISSVLIINPKVLVDERGFFVETFQARRFAEAGLPTHFVQENLSGSHQGILRGLHYQIRQAQGKLVQVMVGEIYDVVVDLRRNSPAFGKWNGIKLSSKDQRQLWVPEGFAHGFYVLSDWAELVYKTTDFYEPEWERTLLWNDPVLNIPWPLLNGKPPLLSPKDAKGKRLSEAEVYQD